MRLIIRNLTKIIDKNIVLDKISVSFESGKIHGLTGARHSGKTLFFRCISGEEAFDKGHIRINRGVRDEKIGFWDVGCALSNSAVPEFLTGAEFVTHFLELHDMEVTEKIVTDYLEIIGIDENMRNQQIYYYSNEVKGHLQLLCVYILKPDIVLVEEPMEEYSEGTAQLLKRLLDELKKSCVVIMSTGNVKLLKEICDDVVVLEDGILSNASLGELSLEGQDD